MELYRINISIGDRSVATVVRQGVLASIETGVAVNGMRKPLSRILAIVNDGSDGPVSWVQVAEFDESGSPKVAFEGWVTRNSPGRLQALGKSQPLRASLETVEDPSEEMLKCQADAKFGSMSCCTSYGNGCYVTCCNSCCSDPVGCPGAGCCG